MGAIVFVDIVSDFTDVVPMIDITLDDTLLEKTSIEDLENDGGVTFKSY